MLKLKMRYSKIYKIGNFTFEVDWSTEIESKQIQALIKIVQTKSFQTLGLFTVIQYLLFK